MMSKLIHTYTTFLTIAAFLLFPAVHAQQEEDMTKPGPIFLSAFRTVTEAEKLEKEKFYKQSWEKYHQALRYYKTLSNAHPDWKPHLVNGRLETTEEAIKRITPMAEREYALQRDRMANLVEGNANNADAGIPDPAGKVFTQSETKDLTNINKNISYNQQMLEKEKLKHAGEVRQLNNTIKTLQDQLTQMSKGQDSTQVRILNGEIARLQQKLRTAEMNDKDTREKYIQTLDELQRQRSLLASAPLRQDVEKLREETTRQRRELEVISRSHKKQELELANLRKEQAASQTENLVLQAQLKRTKEQLDVAQNNANAVVSALRKENAALLKKVTEQQEQLNAQTAQIRDLEDRLSKSNEIADELRRDLAKVTLERDQLTELLQLSDVERGKELMKENLRLAGELADAKRDLQILHKDKNSAQDRIIEAETNLAIAKNEIIRLKDEKTSYMKRVTQLEATLKDTRDQLSQKLNQPNLDDSSREEAEVLRGTVQRLMAAQKRRRQVDQIFVEEYEKIAKKDENLEKLIKSFAENDITLTEQELKLVAEQDSTDTFVNPLTKYADEATRDVAQQKLEEKKSTYHSMAKRFIEKGRLEIAKDIYDEAYDTTYDFNFLVNRGVIRLRLGDETGDPELYQEAARIFETGVTTRSGSPYTHFMLGMARYRLQENDLAAKSLEHAIDLKPDYPMAYLYLGIIAANSNQLQKAEENFDNAIRLNPEFHDAHYNMSVLYLLKGDIKEARRYYNDALRSGHPINPEHERKLGINKAG